MFTIQKAPIALAAAAAMLAPAAFAGGYVAPVEPAPIVAPVTQAPAPWAGAYVGGSVGYSFGADDEIGLELFEDSTPQAFAPGLGNVDISGPTAGLHVGYRWQRQRWVFGPELGIEFGNVDDKDELAFRGTPTGVTAKTEMNHILSLRMKAGYLVDDRTMIFGTAGVVKGDFDYTLTDGTDKLKESDSPTGYSVGLGVERKMTDRLSLTAEWEYRNFGKTDIDFDEGIPGEFLRTEATPEHHNVKLGLNFSF